MSKLQTTHRTYLFTYLLTSELTFSLKPTSPDRTQNSPRISSLILSVLFTELLLLPHPVTPLELKEILKRRLNEIDSPTEYILSYSNLVGN